MLIAARGRLVGSHTHGQVSKPCVSVFDRKRFFMSGAVISSGESPSDTANAAGSPGEVSMWLQSERERLRANLRENISTFNAVWACNFQLGSCI